MTSRSLTRLGILVYFFIGCSDRNEEQNTNERTANNQAGSAQSGGDGGTYGAAASNNGGTLGGGGGFSGGGGAGGAGGAPTCTFCDGSCVDTTSNNSHCGKCFSKCATTCDSGSCVAWKSVHVGMQFMCLLAENKSLWCVGENEFGQLGDGSGEAQKTPKKIIENVENVVVSSANVCASTEDKKFYCWGYGLYGAVGSGAFEHQKIPYQINIPTVLDFSTDGQNTCAISSDKNLYCWGQNNFNELQTNDQKPSAVPIKIDTQKNQDKIFVGYSRICIKSNADFYCWGNNAWGEFSNDFPYTDTKIHKIGSNELIQSISLGSDFFCYLLNDGKVYCSGKNQYGQLGKNDTSPQKNLITPVTIPPAIQIDSTNHHTCALTEDSELYCWGINEFMPGENPPNNSCLLYTSPSPRD